MRGLALFGAIGIAATLWALYRKATGKPIIPQLGQTAEAAPYDAMKEGLAIDPASNTATTDDTAADVIDSIDMQAKEKFEKVPGYALQEEFANKAVPQSDILPVAAGIAAGGAALAALKARKALRKVSGVKVEAPKFLKAKSGLVTLVKDARTGKTVQPAKPGAPLPKQVGTGPIKQPTTVKVQAPKPIPKTPAITPTAPQLAAKAPAAATAAKVGTTAVRVASKALLPVGIALSAYDLTDRAVKKGAQNLTAGDVAAAATGLGGWGITKHLPAPIQGALKTKLTDIPKVVSTAVQQATQKRTAAAVAKPKQTVAAAAKPVRKTTATRTAKAPAAAKPCGGCKKK